VTTRATDNADKHRFEVFLDDELAGFTKYHVVEEGIAFDHTEIDDRFEGKGLGSTLVSAALDAARARGFAVLPFCPFVRGYIARHEEYVDLVPEDQRPRFGL
jgi:predicted GNAT family acetyltransferase